MCSEVDFNVTTITLHINAGQNSRLFPAGDIALFMVTGGELNKLKKELRTNALLGTKKEINRSANLRLKETTLPDLKRRQKANCAVNTQYRLLRLIITLFSLHEFGGLDLFVGQFISAFL